MRKKLLRFLSCVITIAITICGAQYVGQLLDPLETCDALNSIKAFHSLEKNSIDVCFYGSSHVWKGCDPLVLEEKYGLSAYNYAGNWQAFNTTLLFLRDSFRTQSPKVVCIDTYAVYWRLKDTELNGQIYYTRGISSFAGKKEYLKDCFGSDWKNYIPYYFPIVMFHDNWKCITGENFFGNHSVSYYLATRGYEPSTNTVKVDLTTCINSETQYELSDSSIEMLDAVLELCRENGTEIIFYTCPYSGEFCFGDALEEYAKERDCIYLNLMEESELLGLDGDCDFRDIEHLSDSGSRKIADYLGGYIVEHFDIR